MSQAGSKSEPAAKIGEDNVGNKMLQKMGWKSGTGLGKNSDGRTEIIEVSANVLYLTLSLVNSNSGGNFQLYMTIAVEA